MRRSLRIALAFAFSVLACAMARAGASASVEFAGPGSFDINLGTTRDFLPAEGEGAHGFTLETSGAIFTMANVSVGVPRGGSADFFYDYTIALHDDGLVAERSWGFCVPLRASNCGPQASGNELAAVTLVAGLVGSPFGSPYVSVSGESVFLSTDGGSFADGVTQNGRLHVRVQASGDPFAPAIARADFVVYALATADASPVTPVPEPASFALVLAGLGAVALRARRLRRA